MKTLRLWLALVLVLSASVQSGTLLYTYDAAGRLTSVDFGDGTSLRYTYDAAGNILSQEVISITLALSPAPLALTAGTAGVLTVRLSAALSASTTVALSSSNPAVATVPPTVNIPAGQTSVTVSVTPVGLGTATITATLPAGLGSRTTTVTVVVEAVPVVESTYAIVNRGGISLSTTGTAAQVGVGYARIVPNSGNTTPAGVAIFGFRQNGVLVTEAGVPASPLIRTGRIYAEVSGPANTGLAIANPNGQTANISFFFTDASGANFGAGNMTVPANGQRAAFLNQAPFNGGSSVSGTFTFTSDVPVGVIALRGYSNERGDFLITTLPVADLSQPAGSSAALFPHFADGGGWTTQVVLVNGSDQTLTGTVQFFGQGSASAPAQPVAVIIGGVTASSFTYTIPARSSRVLKTSGAAAAIAAGSVRIVPQPGSQTPAGLGIFSFKTAGVTVTEAGVPLSGLATAQRMYAEASGADAGSIQTGVAVANTGADPVNVTFELTRLNGSLTGLSGSLTVPGNGQVASFLGQIPGLGSLPIPFQGVLRITTSSGSGVSVVGLRGRTNERGDFLITTTPPVNENTPASGFERVFPHFADGGGWSTQFILFSGSANQTADGRLRYFGQAGAPLALRLK